MPTFESLKPYLLFVMYVVAFAGGWHLYKHHGAEFSFANRLLRLAPMFEDLIYIHRFTLAVKQIRRKACLYIVFVFGSWLLITGKFAVPSICLFLGFVIKSLSSRKYFRYSCQEYVYALINTFKPFAYFSEDDLEEAMERYFIASLRGIETPPNFSFSKPLPGESDWE